MSRSIPASACVLFGASPATGNQGVTALAWSTLAGLAARGIDDVTVFDHGAGARAARCPAGGGAVDYRLQGAPVGRRLWRRDHLRRLSLAARLGGPSSPALARLRSAGAVLDLSGGDSFTDLYGPKRFAEIAAPKRIALDLRRPLLLPPQTIGPFDRPRSREAARRLLVGAEAVWARDADSLDRLRALLGDDYDSARHRLGVDVAFGLRPAVTRLPAPVCHWLREPRGSRPRPVVGLNTSGLLCDDDARGRFGLADDHRALLLALVRALLAETDARVLLVPHVHAPSGHPESDLAAARTLLAGLGDSADRVAVLGDALDAARLKSVITRCDWFCGARMHATIAGLSAGVATAGLAYSVKARGVFASCESEASHFDLRTRATGPLVDDLLAHFAARATHRRVLRRALPATLARHGETFDALAAAITGGVAERAA